MIFVPIYCHVKAGTAFKPGSLVGDHAVRADYVTLPNGDAVGRLTAKGAECRKVLEAQPGITVLPPLHRAITQEHIDAFSHCGAAQGDTAYDVAEKLHNTHGMFWMHPEEPAI